jgi:hypothetical protein
LAAEARRAETGECAYGKIKVRHPLFGRERNLSVNCIPLVGIESLEERRILVILEDSEGAKGGHLSPDLSIGRYLGLLRGGLIAFGREIHERSAGWKDHDGGESLLAALGMIIRDLDTLAAVEKIRSGIGTPPAERKSEVVVRRALRRAQEISGIESVFDGKTSGGEDHEGAKLILRAGKEDLEILLTVALETVGVCDPDPSVSVKVERLPDRVVVFFSALTKGQGVSKRSRRGANDYRSKFLPVRLELLRLLVGRLKGGVDWDGESLTLRLEIPCEHRIAGEPTRGTNRYAMSFFTDLMS